MGFKIKYDSRKVDRTKSAVDFSDPPPRGLYPMTIKEVKFRKDKNDLEFVVRIKDGDYKNFGFWDYVSLGEASDWKVDQYLQAIGIDTEAKARGTIDIDMFLNKDVLGRVKHETYEGEPKAKLAAVFFPRDADDEDEDDEEDEDELDEDEEEDDEEELDDEEEEDDELDEDEDEDEDDEELEDDDEELEDDEDEEEEDEDDEDEEEEPPPPRRTKKAPAKAAPAAKKAAAKKAPPAPAKKAASKKAAPAPAAKAKKTRKPNYDDMSLEELQAECKARGLAGKGSRSAIVARLRANDDDPFSD